MTLVILFSTQQFLTQIDITRAARHISATASATFITLSPSERARAAAPSAVGTADQRMEQAAKRTKTARRMKPQLEWFQGSKAWSPTTGSFLSVQNGPTIEALGSIGRFPNQKRISTCGFMA
jgi:hypothetical protein